MDITAILPANRTRLEEGFLLAFNEFVNDVDILYPYLLDAQRCPEEVLLYLANDRGVSNWDEVQSTEEKRIATQNQWQLRTLNGTKAGFELAVAAIDGEVEVTPWHTSGDEPYNLSVRVWVQRPINSANTNHIAKKATEAKLERDVLTVGIGAKTETDNYQALGTVSACITTIAPYVVSELNSDSVSLSVLGMITAPTFLIEAHQ